jgi:hypothetical protein
MIQNYIFKSKVEQGFNTRGRYEDKIIWVAV